MATPLGIDQSSNAKEILDPGQEKGSSLATAKGRYTESMYLKVTKLPCPGWGF